MTFAAGVPCATASKPVNPPLTTAPMAIASVVLCHGKLRHLSSRRGIAPDAARAIVYSEFVMSLLLPSLIGWLQTQHGVLVLIGIEWQQ